MGVSKEAWFKVVSVDLERQRNELIQRLQRREIDLDSFYQIMKRYESGEKRAEFLFLESEHDEDGKLTRVMLTEPWLRAHKHLLDSFEGYYRRLFFALRDLEEKDPEAYKHGFELMLDANYIDGFRSQSFMGARPTATLGGRWNSPLPKSEEHFNDYVSSTIQEIKDFVNKWEDQSDS